MKRLHIHISVDAIEPSTAFYSALFGADPTVVKDDYVKWEIEDPHINLAISDREGFETGINHVGIQAGSEAELEDLHARLDAAEIASAPEKDAHCCYANGNKHWTKDPSNVIWEMFHTLSDAPTYGDDSGPDMSKPQEAKLSGAKPAFSGPPSVGLSCC